MKKVVGKWQMDQLQQFKRKNFALVLKSALDAMANLPLTVQNRYATLHVVSCPSLQML